MAEQEIGAARVHLVVDATDYDAAIARATNAARGFGNDAEQAFDKSSGGVRRAARQLLDYVSNLGKTSDQLRLLRAAQQGVDHSIIDAAAAAMVDYRQQTEAAAAAARDLARAQDEANRINSAFNDQRATNAQRDINSVLGVGTADAEQQARRRAEAEAALLPILQREEAAYEAIYAEALKINQARDEHNRLLSQQNFNTDLGVDQPRSGAYLAEQQRVVAALTQQFNEMDAAIDQAFTQNSEIERFRQQLENLQKTAGKTHYELLQMRADQLGVGESFRPIIKSIQDQDAAMGHAGITAKQYEWAMRGLPAQITDIAVSLVSGQPAYLVALQQGGQIKDMFGGIAPAARALGGALLGMVNPLTVSAVAVAALGYAWYQASEQAIAFEKSIQSTGNRAGLTAVEIGQFASAAASATNSSAGAANEAALAVAATGRVTANAFRDTTVAVLNMAELTGQSVDSIAEKFAALQGDPVKAMMKLDETLNFATIDLYNQVKALEAQGDAHAAAGLVAKAAADATAEAIEKVDDKLNWLQRGLKDAKVAASEWLLSMENAIGLASQAEELQVLQRRRTSNQSVLDEAVAKGYDTGKGLLASTKKQVDADTAKINEILKQGAKDRADAEIKADAQAAQRVAIAQAELIDSQASNATKRANEIKKVQGENLRARLALMLEGSKTSVAAADQIAQKEAEQIAAINKKYADKHTARAGGQGSDGTQAIRDQAAAEIAAITTQTRLLQSQYDQRQITVEDYYAKLQQYADDELAVTLRSIEAQKVAVAGRKDASTRIGQLEAQAARAREQNAARGIELSEGERKAVQQRTWAYEDYVRTIDRQVEATQRAADLEVARVGMGQKEYERMVQLNDTIRERDRLEEELNQKRDRGELQAGEIDRYREALEKVNDQIKRMPDNWAAADEAQANELNGMSAAWKDYASNAANVSEQTKSLLTDAFTGMEDAFVKFVQTGKLSFSDLANSIIADLARIAAKQAITGIFGSAFNAILGSTIGGVTKEAIPISFATGGYTGDGGKFEPAGIVHKGEGVVPQWGIAAMGGPAAFMGFLGTLRGGRGYADGGVAGMAASVMSRSSAPNVQINIENKSSTNVTAQPSDVKFDGEKWVINIMANDLSSGGKSLAAIKGRLDVKERI